MLLVAAQPQNHVEYTLVFRKAMQTCYHPTTVHPDTRVAPTARPYDAPRRALRGRWPVAAHDFRQVFPDALLESCTDLKLSF